MTSTLKTISTASEFIDEKLRLYSAHSNIRGIPFIGDGFKQAHRKAVWGLLKRGENADKDTVERTAAATASCFTSNTPVLMSDMTYKTIGDIIFSFSSGQELFVKSYQNGEFVDSKIENAFLTTFVNELIELEFDNGVITCTPDHKFLTDRGWVEAKDLTHDDNIVNF